MSWIKKIKNGWSVTLEWKGKEYWRHFAYKREAQDFQKELMKAMIFYDSAFSPNWMKMES